MVRRSQECVRRVLPHGSAAETCSCKFTVHRLATKWRHRFSWYLGTGYLLDVGTRDSAFSIGFIKVSTQPCFASRSPILHVVTHSACKGETLFPHWFLLGFPCRDACSWRRGASSETIPICHGSLFYKGFSSFSGQPCSEVFFWPRGFACFPRFLKCLCEGFFLDKKKNLTCYQFDPT